jgi:hypothetical protein
MRIPAVYAPLFGALKQELVAARTSNGIVERTRRARQRYPIAGQYGEKEHAVRDDR